MDSNLSNTNEQSEPALTVTTIERHSLPGGGDVEVYKTTDSMVDFAKARLDEKQTYPLPDEIALESGINECIVVSNETGEVEIHVWDVGGAQVTHNLKYLGAVHITDGEKYTVVAKSESILAATVIRTREDGTTVYLKK